MYRVHIVGVAPRTGTTLMAESMVVCFDIDLSEPHERHIDRHKTCRGIYLTKSPDDLELLGPRLYLDRRLWVICLMRDPRDVVASRHGRERNRYWTPLRLWKKNLALIRNLQRHPRFMVLRYEDLAEDPDGVQDLIEKRMPFLRRRARFSEYADIASPSSDSLDALRGIRPISSSSVGNWRSHLPRVAGQIERHGHISRELVELGYEPDSRWESLLVGVEPDTADSVHSEIAPPRMRQFWKRRVMKAYPIALLGMICDRLRIPFL